MSNRPLAARSEPRRHDLVFRAATLAARTFLTPSYVRLRFGRVRSEDHAPHGGAG